MAEQINAAVWAPQYTSGLEEDNVAKMHSQGRLAFVWSLDKKFMLDHYLKEGGYDGVVTNTPSVVAFWYYTNNRPVDTLADTRPETQAAAYRRDV